MSFDADPSSLVPVDEVFKMLLAKGRAMAAAKERLEATDAARAARAAAEANRIAARYEWKPRCAIAMVEEQHCLSCANVQQVFRGFGISMRRAADGTERIVGTSGLDASLRAERYIIHSSSEACIECLPERGV